MQAFLLFTVPVYINKIHIQSFITILKTRVLMSIVFYSLTIEILFPFFAVLSIGLRRLDLVFVRSILKLGRKDL